MAADWGRVSVGFFAYVALTAELRPRVAPRARLAAFALSAAGAALAVGAIRLPATHPLNVWVLPTVILYLSYRATGVLFSSPMTGAERVLAAFDRMLEIDRVAHRTPRWIAELLEFAYAGIYALIVLALALAVWIGVTAARFWTVVLLTDFVCFGMLPWIQTRTPRETVDPQPWRSSLRPMNLRLVNAGSIGVNTCPSGHAAEALAAALLTLGTPWPISAAMFLAAAAVSAGAVYGRYHYALDVLAGWAVAVAVYFLST